MKLVAPIVYLVAALSVALVTLEPEGGWAERAPKAAVAQKVVDPCAGLKHRATVVFDVTTKEDAGARKLDGQTLVGQHQVDAKENCTRFEVARMYRQRGSNADHRYYIRYSFKDGGFDELGRGFGVYGDGGFVKKR